MADKRVTHEWVFGFSFFEGKGDMMDPITGLVATKLLAAAAAEAKKQAAKKAAEKLEKELAKKAEQAAEKKAQSALNPNANQTQSNPRPTVNKNIPTTNNVVNKLSDPRNSTQPQNTSNPRTKNTNSPTAQIQSTVKVISVSPPQNIMRKGIEAIKAFQQKNIALVKQYMEKGQKFSFKGTAKDIASTADEFGKLNYTKSTLKDFRKNFSTRSIQIEGPDPKKQVAELGNQKPKSLIGELIMALLNKAKPTPENDAKKRWEEQKRNQFKPPKPTDLG